MCKGFGWVECGCSGSRVAMSAVNVGETVLKLNRNGRHRVGVV